MNQNQVESGRAGRTTMGRGVRAVVLAAAVGLVGLPATASAQDRGGDRGGDRPQQRDGARDMGRMFGGMGQQNQIQESDVELMASVLEFDEPQQLLAEELFADLREQRAQLMVEMREQMQELRGEGGRPDREAMEKFRTMAEEAQAKATEMEKVFYEDIKLVLTPEQHENWSEFETSRDRARALRGVGGAVDVSRVFATFVEKHESSLGENDLAGAKALASRFESEIDRQIAERAKLLEQGRPNPGDGGFDRDAMREMLEARREADAKLGEIATRYADSIERTLPDELREAFRFEINRGSLGGMARRGSVVDRVESALKSEDLDDAQKQAVRAIEADMHKQYNALAKEIADMRAQARDRRGQDNGRGGQRGGDREGGNDIRERMQEIETELSTRLRAVLGDGDV